MSISSRQTLWERFTSTPYKFVISHAPVEIDQDRIEPNTEFALEKADDEQVVLNKNDPFDPILDGTCIAFAVASALLAIFASNSGADIFWYGLMSLGLISTPVYRHTQPDRKLIFDRKNQTVTLPPKFWSKPLVCAFTDLQAYSAAASIGGGTGFLTFLGGRTEDARAGRKIDVNAGEPQKANWSFIVWYMDKNRPLPPSEALDPYRERDDARRAAEGHPPPLFPAAFDTDAYSRLPAGRRAQLAGQCLEAA